MERMRSVLVSVVCIAGLFGQEANDLFHKAPPAVDEALRARIKEFFQLHVDGKFRQAESLVAEESKDFFYSANKPKYLGFEIKSIAYSDNFTKAKATVVAQMVVMAPGFLGKPVSVPLPSRWKIENGQWCWYVDPDELNMTPFGKMKGGTVSAGAAPPQSIPSAEEAAKLLEGVKAEKTEAELKIREINSAEYTIVNTMPGKVALYVEPVLFPGIDVNLDVRELAPGQKAHVNVEWHPSPKVPRAIEVRVHVQPTNQVIKLIARFTN
jgi:hypothetical protein